MSICLILIGFLTSCQTFQDGGYLEVDGKAGYARVYQADNAEDPADLKYDEDSVNIEHNPGDEIDIRVEKTPFGKKTYITFRPKNKGTSNVSTIKSKSDTGHSYEDVAAKMRAFLEAAEPVMYFGIACVGAAVIMAAFLNLYGQAIIVGGCGIGIIIFSQMAPALTEYAWMFAIALISLPFIWYFHFYKIKKVATASVKAHEEFKRENPEAAKKMSESFKRHAGEHVNVARNLKK